MKRGPSNPGEAGRIFLNLIILLFLAVFCLALYLVRHPLLRFIAESWIVEDTLDKALARIVKERKWHSVMVVTSNFHTRRTRYIFLRVFPQSVEVRVASARDGDFDPEHWWEKRKSIKELTKEFAGMVVAVWELRGKSETSEKTQSVVEWRGPIPLCIV